MGNQVALREDLPDHQICRQMEFLKNHYEKMILSLVLIGLAGAAGWLALQSMSFRGTISAINEMAPVPKPPDEINRTNEFFVALTNAKAPQEVDFDGAHKIFNPEKILRRIGDTVLIPEGGIGPKNLEIQQIRPLRLRLRAESKLVVGKPRLYVHYLPEFEMGNYAKRWGKSTATEGRTIRLTGPVARARRVTLVVNKIGGDLLKPETLAIEMDLVVGAGLPEPVVLQGTNVWDKEFEFEVDMFYPPLERNYTGIRMNAPLVFAGDTNTVIQITRDEVTLRATSNDKRITLSLTKQQNETVDAGKSAMPAAEGGDAMPDGVPPGQMPANGAPSPDGQAPAGTGDAGAPVPNVVPTSAPKKATGAP